jgi:hypothetical protein
MHIGKKSWKPTVSLREITTFGSQKYTFKRKELSFRAKGRKVGYSDSRPTYKDITRLKNL